MPQIDKPTTGKVTKAVLEDRVAELERQLTNAREQIDKQRALIDQYRERAEKAEAGQGNGKVERQVTVRPNLVEELADDPLVKLAAYVIQGIVTHYGLTAPLGAGKHRLIKLIRESKVDVSAWLDEE